VRDTVLDELGGMFYLILKDLKAYYFKPPNISWGVLFPLVMALAFTLRNPSGLAELFPGLVAMAALFGTTSMEAIVITFEKRVGALERLMLAPLSLWTILMGKVLGGSIFGVMMAGAMTLISLALLGGWVTSPLLFTLSILLTVLVHSALGALIAVSVREVFEAQTLSNYFRFPMIFLCGVFLPVGAMPLPLRLLAHALPLTYSVDALRQTSMGPLNPGLFLADVLALILFLSVFLASAMRMLNKSLE